MRQRFHLHTPLVETIGEAGSAAEAKCRLHYGQVLVLGIMAAAYLGLATTLALAAGATIASPSVQKLAMGAVFPVGLIAVIMAVSELSTGNYLVTPLGAVTGTVGWKHVLYNWATSYAGNFLGAVSLAAIVIQGAHVLTGALWGQPWIDLLTKLTVAKAHLSPTEAFWRGFLCIWLVDLAVWQAYRVKETTAKFLLIFFPTFAFFTLSLEHSVVNMFLFPAAIFAGVPITWTEFLLNNLVPVVLGNAVGGTFIVGMLYWFSAGLPQRNLNQAIATEERNGNVISVPLVQGSLATFGAGLLKALGITAIFVLLFPVGAAGLSLLIAGSRGPALPIAVTFYLCTVAYGLFLWHKHRKGPEA